MYYYHSQRAGAVVSLACIAAKVLVGNIEVGVLQLSL
jgi:hypothetical protein